jgi:hypothetical protein
MYLEDSPVAARAAALAAVGLDEASVGVDERHLARRERLLEADAAVDLAIWRPKSKSNFQL